MVLPGSRIAAPRSIWPRLGVGVCWEPGPVTRSCFRGDGAHLGRPGTSASANTYPSYYDHAVRVCILRKLVR